MVFEEVPQCHEQLSRMSNAPRVERLMNVIDNHGPNRFTSVWLRKQVARECRSGYVWDMLVLTDCGHLLFIEPTKANAIFQ